MVYSKAAVYTCKLLLYKKIWKKGVTSTVSSKVMRRTVVNLELSALQVQTTGLHYKLPLYCNLLVYTCKLPLYCNPLVYKCKLPLYYNPPVYTCKLPLYCNLPVYCNPPVYERPLAEDKKFFWFAFLFNTPKEKYVHIFLSIQ